ncbi:MAG: dihydroorotate dehydrogenase electron transfer subunit [Candidatus Marinimicrobia bacterium]|nr:dihydroorotate dehydrogenase electron transfer subunit [Candidatus Neomarinimicrobiota bacterium]
MAHQIWEMQFEAPQIATAYKGSGQFINILARDDWNHPLRRPMSIASAEGGCVSIIYKLFGGMTKVLSKKISGETVELLGPLGNTFSNWNNGSYPILIGGGVGLAPMLNLKQACEHNKIDHTIIIGARSGNEHFIDHDPTKNIYLTTDDGSIGEKGTVMGPLEGLIKENTNAVLYACGPEPMLKAVKEFAMKNNMNAQLSVESYMGCGIGLCQGCVIQRKNSEIQSHSYHEKYSLVCMDGPVYQATEVDFG